MLASMLEANLCPSCNAPVHFAAGHDLADCPYCGTQVRLTGATAAPPPGPGLAETIALKVGDDVVPLIPAGRAVPLALDETFSTSRDGQDVLHVTLVARRDGARDRELAAIAFPITQRAPRGVPQVKARLTVDAAGAAQLALHEPGTDNRQLVPLGTIAVRGA